MTWIKKHSPQVSRKMVSVLIGCALAVAFSFHQTAVLTPVPIKEQFTPPKHKLSDARGINDMNGIFGFSFLSIDKSQKCNHATENLTGIVIREDNTLFIIEGTTGIRVYHLTEHIDGKYPIMAYDENHVIIRKNGSNFLLCLEKHKNANQRSTPVAASKAKTIITPYFSLIPVSDSMLNTIGYIVTQCGARCKIALAATGLRRDDILIAINNKPVDNTIWQQFQESANTGKTIVMTVKRADDKGIIDVPVIQNNSLKQLLTKEH